MNTELWAVLITGGFSVVVALIALVEQRMRKAIGTPNGQGNVVEMLHQLLAGQAIQDGRLVTIEQRLNHGDERFTNIEGRLTSIERKPPEEAA